MTGGSHSRRATGGDFNLRQESSCGRTFLTGVEQLLLVPVPSRQSRAAGVGRAGVRWHGAAPLFPALSLALLSHSGALVALLGNRGSAAPRPAGPLAAETRKAHLRNSPFGGGGVLVNGLGCRRQKGGEGNERGS